MTRSIGSILPLLLLFLLPQSATGQTPDVRVGFGFNGMLSSSDGLGIGVRARAARVVNSDLSLALDFGVTGFVLQGRDDATYVFDPQASLIITLPPGPTGAGYFLGGFGAYLPFADNGTTDSGPSLHLGLGWVRGLDETTLFYEVDPQLIIGREDISFAIPLRIGVIF